MIKTLTKHGNSNALIIDRPIMRMLEIDEHTPLSLKIEGDALVIRKAGMPFEQALLATEGQYDATLKKLAGPLAPGTD